jgi:hypothetical protein
VVEELYNADVPWSRIMEVRIKDKNNRKNIVVA